jgi:hypothetical protein
MDGGPWRTVDEHWPDGVEEYLKGAEEGFAQEGIEKKSFESCGEVGVQPGYPKRFVMRQVIWLHGPKASARRRI